MKGEEVNISEKKKKQIQKKHKNNKLVNAQTRKEHKIQETKHRRTYQKRSGQTRTSHNITEQTNPKHKRR